MNWRSVSNFLAPLVFSRCFVWGQANGQLGAPFFAAALSSLLAELAFLQVDVGEVTRTIGAQSTM